MTTVGIVSPGAMGSAVGRMLAAGGARVVATVAGRSARTARLAAGLELLGSLEEVVGVADVVLSIVPPEPAPEVAAEIARAASAADARPLVADLNAVAPATMRRIASTLAAAGLAVVDGSISGPPPRTPDSTLLYLSGPQAERVAALPGLAWRVVGPKVGSASAVKMSTAAIYKGESALLAQSLRTAHANGVLAFVLDDLRDGFPDLVERAAWQLQTAASKSGRYAGEMEEIAATQAAAGLTPLLYEAMAEVYRRMSTTDAGRAAPEDVDRDALLADVLARLAE